MQVMMEDDSLVNSAGVHRDNVLRRDNEKGEIVLGERERCSVFRKKRRETPKSSPISPHVCFHSLNFRQRLYHVRYNTRRHTFKHSWEFFISTFLHSLMQNRHRKFAETWEVYDGKEGKVIENGVSSYSKQGKKLNGAGNVIWLQTMNEAKINIAKRRASEWHILSAVTITRLTFSCIDLLNNLKVKWRWVC